MTHDQLKEAEAVGAHLGDAFNELWRLSIIMPRDARHPCEPDRLAAIHNSIKLADEAITKMRSI